MSEQILKGAQNQFLGIVETMSDGQQVLRGAQNQYLGCFDPETNITKGAQNQFVGTGNLLMTLLR